MILGKLVEIQKNGVQGAEGPQNGGHAVEKVGGEGQGDKCHKHLPLKQSVEGKKHPEGAARGGIVCPVVW